MRLKSFGKRGQDHVVLLICEKVEFEPFSLSERADRRNSDDQWIFGESGK